MNSVPCHYNCRQKQIINYFKSFHTSRNIYRRPQNFWKKCTRIVDHILSYRGKIIKKKKSKIILGVFVFIILIFDELSHLIWIVVNNLILGVMVNFVFIQVGVVLKRTVFGGRNWQFKNMIEFNLRDNASPVLITINH